MVAPVKSRRPPFWVWNQGLNQLYMSAFHLAPDLVPAYLGAAPAVSHSLRVGLHLRTLRTGSRPAGREARRPQHDCRPGQR